MLNVSKEPKPGLGGTIDTAIYETISHLCGLVYAVRTEGHVSSSCVQTELHECIHTSLCMEHIHRLSFFSQGLHAVDKQTDSRFVGSYDVPAYYDCSREVEADCYACAFPKCYEWELARSQTIPQYPIAAGEVAEVCEEAAMKYCDYGLVKGTSSDGYVHEDREHQH